MKEAKKLIAALRCEVCGRTPTKEWQAEMYKKIGHKIAPRVRKLARTGEKLVWLCPACETE